MRSFWLLALGLSLPAMASVESELARCATIADKLDRLICYDTLAEQSAAGIAPAAAVAVPVAAASSAATPAAVAAPVAPAAPAAPAAAVAVDDSFGKVKKAEDEPDRIELEVAKSEKDQHGNLKLTFTNGQVWKQTESRNYKVSAGDKVFIEKGALGAFYLGSASRNSTIRVKRLN